MSEISKLPARHGFSLQRPFFTEEERAQREDPRTLLTQTSISSGTWLPKLALSRWQRDDAIQIKREYMPTFFNHIESFIGKFTEAQSERIHGTHFNELLIVDNDWKTAKVGQSDTRGLRSAATVLTLSSGYLKKLLPFKRRLDGQWVNKEGNPITDDERKLLLVRWLRSIYGLIATKMTSVSEERELQGLTSKVSGIDKKARNGLRSVQILAEAGLPIRSTYDFYELDAQGRRLEQTGIERCVQRTLITALRYEQGIDYNANSFVPDDSVISAMLKEIEETNLYDLVYTFEEPTSFSETLKEMIHLLNGSDEKFSGHYQSAHFERLSMHLGLFLDKELTEDDWTLYREFVSKYWKHSRQSRAHRPRPMRVEPRRFLGESKVVFDGTARKSLRAKTWYRMVDTHPFFRGERAVSIAQSIFKDSISGLESFRGFYAHFNALTTFIPGAIGAETFKAEIQAHYKTKIDEFKKDGKIEFSAHRSWRPIFVEVIRQEIADANLQALFLGKFDRDTEIGGAYAGMDERFKKSSAKRLQYAYELDDVSAIQLRESFADTEDFIWENLPAYLMHGGKKIAHPKWDWDFVAALANKRGIKTEELQSYIEKRICDFCVKDRDGYLKLVRAIKPNRHAEPGFKHHFIRHDQIFDAVFVPDASTEQEIGISDQLAFGSKEVSLLLRDRLVETIDVIDLTPSPGRPENVDSLKINFIEALESHATHYRLKKLMLGDIIFVLEHCSWPLEHKQAILRWLSIEQCKGLTELSQVTEVAALSEEIHLLFTPDRLRKHHHIRFDDVWRVFRKFRVYQSAEHFLGHAVRVLQKDNPTEAVEIDTILQTIHADLIEESGTYLQKSSPNERKQYLLKISNLIGQGKNEGLDQGAKWKLQKYLAEAAMECDWDELEAFGYFRMLIDLSDASTETDRFFSKFIFPSVAAMNPGSVLPTLKRGVIFDRSLQIKTAQKVLKRECQLLDQLLESVGSATPEVVQRSYRIVEIFDAIAGSSSKEKDEVLEDFAYRFQLRGKHLASIIEDRKSYNMYKMPDLIGTKFWLIGRAMAEMKTEERKDLLRFLMKPEDHNAMPASFNGALWRAANKIGFKDIEDNNVYSDDEDNLQASRDADKQSWVATLEHHAFRKMRFGSFRERLVLADFLLAEGDEALATEDEGVRSILSEFMGYNAIRVDTAFAFFRATPQIERTPTLAYMLLNKEDENDLRSLFLPFKTPGKKLGQGSYYFKIFGERSEQLREMLDDADPMSLARVEEICRSELSKKQFGRIRRFVKVLGAASLKTAVLVELEDGSFAVCLARDPYAEAQTKEHLKVLRLFVDDLRASGVLDRANEEQDFAVDAGLLELMIQALEAQLMSEINQYEEYRKILKMADLVSEHKPDGLDIDVPLPNENFTPKEGLLFVDVAGGGSDILKLTDLTEEEKDEVLPSVLDLIFKIFLKTGFFDPDRHIGNLLFSRGEDGKVRAHLLDFGQLTQFTDRGLFRRDERYNLMRFIASLAQSKPRALVKTAMHMLTDDSEISDSSEANALRDITDYFESNPESTFEQRITNIVSLLCKHGLNLSPKFFFDGLKGMLTLGASDIVDRKRFEQALEKTIRKTMYSNIPVYMSDAVGF